MGNIFTKAIPQSTSEATKQILNLILKEMFRRADFVDLYSLADPERCKRYIVTAESALKNLFVRIDLMPTKGPDGVFLFQKLDGLKQANPLGAKQTEYCRLLAFFFIRIFQIYAALALSVMDSDLPREDIKELRSEEEQYRRAGVVLQPTALPGFPAADTKPKSGFFSPFSILFSGGALTGASDSQTFYLKDEFAGNYKILNLFLNRPSGGLSSRDDMRFQNYETMVIPQTELYTFVGDDPATRRVKQNLFQSTPSISFSFRLSELSNVSETITAGLRLTRDGLKLNVELVNPRMQSQPGKVGESVKGELYYATESSENPTAQGRQLPGLLVQLFKEVAERINPIAVSAIPFLQKFKYLRRFEGDVPIEGTRILVPNPKGLFVSGTTDIPIVYTDKVKLKNEDATRTVRFETVLSVKKDKTVVGRPHSYTVSVQLKDMRTEPPYLKSYLPAGKEQTYSVFQTGLQDLDTPRNSQGKTVPEFLQRVFEDIVSGREAEEYNTGIVIKKGIPQPYNSETIPESLRVKKIWQALAKDPPVKSYCVARAVQLLNVSALRNVASQEGYTEACNMKFPYVKEDYLPEPGKSVQEVPAIKAMELLFYELIENAMPGIKDSVRYQTFLRQMRSKFDAPGTAAAAPPVTQTDTLKSVVEMSPTFCSDGSMVSGQLPVRGDVVRQLRAQATQLLRRQEDHLPKVMALLFKMFNQRALQAGRFEFLGTFLAGGMPALNRLAEEARELLMDYYGDCETLYKEGLGMLGTYRRSTAAAAAAAPAPRATVPAPAAGR